MSNIRLNVTDQCICAVEMPAIYSGDVNYDTVTFTFSSDWNSYLKTAVFYRTKDEAYYQVLDRNNVCTIPKEVLKSKGTIFISVFGTLDNKVITSQVISYRIQEGAITEDLNTPDPTPEVFEQALAKCAEAINIANSATSAIANKVDKVAGKGLSTTDVTAAMVNTWNGKLDPSGTAANASKLGGKTESQLSVASAVNSTKLGGKIESQLSVASAVNATNATNATNANDTAKLGGNLPAYYAKTAEVEISKAEIAALGWCVPSEMPLKNSFANGVLTQYVGRVCLGELNWVYDYSYGKHHLRADGQTPNAKPAESNWDTANAYCTKYEVNPQQYVYDNLGDKCISVTTESGIMVYDSSYTNDYDFKLAVKNVFFYYRLRNPITHNINDTNSLKDADTLDGKHANEFANAFHTHTRSQISDFPSSLPANGGNADTVGGYAASAFASASHNHDSSYYTKSQTKPVVIAASAPSDTSALWIDIS